MARKRIGELLVERGAITRAQLEEGLALHRQTRQRLGVALLQKRFITEAQLVAVLSEALGIPAVELGAVQAEWAAVHMLRPRFCETHDLFPYALDVLRGRKNLLVAMSDPLNVPAVEEMEFTTGLKVSPRIATLSSVRAAISRYYHKADPSAAATQAMTIVQAGGVTLTVPDAESTVPRDIVDDDVIVGEAIEESEPPRSRSAAPRPPPARTPVDALTQDLNYLFGVRDEQDSVEQLERKFWALLRLMQKKGLLTSEEFRRELEQDPD